MPIEIRELHIKVSVNAPQQGQPAPQTQRPSQASGQGGQGGAQADLVAECVEQVVQILQNKAER